MLLLLRNPHVTSVQTGGCLTTVSCRASAPNRSWRRLLMFSSTAAGPRLHSPCLARRPPSLRRLSSCLTTTMMTTLWTAWRCRVVGSMALRCPTVASPTRSSLPPHSQTWTPSTDPTEEIFVTRAFSDILSTLENPNASEPFHDY